jgi:uncharacterized delta-60 repeat protein/uncharacterized repeat protein (TIGR02543 family)
MKDMILDSKCKPGPARGRRGWMAALSGGLVLASTLPGTGLKARLRGWRWTCLPGHPSSRSFFGTILLCLCCQLGCLSASARIRDGGIDPTNLGKGEWLYYMSNATNQLGGYVASVTNENSLMLYLKSQGTRYVIVKAATSDQLFYGSYTHPQFTSNLVNAAHAQGLWVLGYNRSYGQNIPAEIAIADYVFNQGADGFVWNAEAEWESYQTWIGTNGPALAWQLCSAVRSNWPTKFLAHSPFAIVGWHDSFPYKEFGYWSDAVMPQIYHFSAAKSPSAAINWTDVNWAYYQNLWSSLPPTNINGLAVYWTNAIKPLVPVQDVYGPPYSEPTPDKDVQEFVDYLAADPNSPALGGYCGANFFRADLHDVQQWAYISAGTPGTVAGSVNNVVLDDAGASLVGAAVSVRTFYVVNNTTPLFQGCGSGTDTNSFGTNYLALAQGSGGNYVEFTPNIVVAGDYTVYQWHPYRAEASAAVPFVINYNGGATTVYANQQTNDGNWSLLGTFNFAAGTSANIRVTDAIPESGGVALADGIKLVFASPATIPPAAPSGLTASAASSSRIDLSWSNNATNVVHNVVGRATVSGGPYMDVAVVPWSRTSCSDTGLAGETTYYYVVRGANAAGASGNSGQASAMTPPAPPEILVHPQSRIVAAGSDVTFSVVASGGAPLTHQWLFNGTNIAGATQSAYTLSSAQGSNAGSYSVVVTNGVGSVTSWEAVLTVVEGLFTLTVNVAGNGSVAKSPDQTSYIAGTVVTVTATPSAGYSFTGWTGDITGTNNPVDITMLSDIALTANFVPSPTDIVLDNTNAAVTFSGSWSTSSSAAGRYGPDYRWMSTIASGSASTATYRPTITVAGYYSISVMYPAGGNRAYSTPFAIQTDDEYIPLAVNQQINGGIWLPLVSQTAHLSPGNAVYVEISNLTGYSGSVVIADAVRFELYQADLPSPVIVSQPASQTVGVGGTATFSVKAYGTPPLSYCWQRNGLPIAGATESTYTTNNVQLADSGSLFLCRVTNAFGSVTSQVATLTVTDPVIITQPVSQDRNLGESVTFSVTAEGTLPLSYQWWKDGLPLAQGTDASLTLTNLQGADAGDYQVVVTGPYGSVTSAVAVLTVNLTTADTFNPGANNDVYCLAVQADGKILVGGTFTNLGGQTRNYLGRLNSDGTLDATFNPEANDWVWSIAVQTDGKIVVGGGFTTLGGQTRNGIGRLNSNGTVDTSFNPGVDGVVLSLAVQADGQIVVGGWFSTLGGQARNCLGRLNSNGTLDTTFNPGADSAVMSLAVQADGRILVVGGFTTLAGQTRNCLGRLNRDGTLDATFNPEANDWVWSIAEQADGKILVGGSFTNLAGQARYYLGRLNSDGALDTDFNPGANAIVYSLSVQADGKILVGGEFTTLGGHTRNYLGRLNSDGTLDTPFNPGASGDVSSLALQADGKILVGGLFTTLAGQPRTSLARLCSTEPATQSLSYDGSNLTWLRGGTSPEVWRTSLDVSANGTDWLSLGAGTRRSGGWQWTNVSVSAGTILRPRGFVTGGLDNASSWFVQTNLVTSAPFIVAHPVSATNNVGTDATFSVVAGGTPTLNYQWRKDGTNLSEATNATLTLANVQESDQGLYSVVVSNAFGSALSAEALLVVNQASSFYSVSLQPDGRVRMQFVADLGPLYTVEASTNLVDWEAIGVATDHGDGTFTFEDANAPGFPNRFYRVVSP